MEPMRLPIKTMIKEGLLPESARHLEKCGLVGPILRVSGGWWENLHF